MGIRFGGYPSRSGKADHYAVGVTANAIGVAGAN